MKALWVVTGIVLIGAVASWASAVPAVPPPDVRVLPASRAFEPLNPPALSAAAERLRQRNPFRLNRQPANTRYNPWEPVVSAPAAMAPARPALRLVGILGGPPWNAVIEGIPNRETGVVLAVNDIVNGFRVTAIRGDTVLVTGQDTTWTLTPKSAWP